MDKTYFWVKKNTKFNDKKDNPLPGFEPGFLLNELF